MSGNFKVLLQIAFRNLFANPLNLVIGLVILMPGTCGVVTCSGLADSIDSSMSRSMIGSVAGHIQVYSEKSKDDLALWGGFGSEPDLSALEDFSKVKKTLEKVPNVKAVVPMGINSAIVTTGNTIDVTLAKLREAINSKDAPAPIEGTPIAVQDSTSRREQIESLKALVRQMIHLLQSDMKKVQEISKTAFDKESEQNLERAASDQFWADFDKDPLNSLEFLENRIAPLATDADLLFIRYVGTDLDQFQKSFDRMEIVDGQAVPEGKRGFLFSKFFYEEALKLKTARRLDKIKEALAEKGKTIATDSELQRFVRENRAQTREILFQLDALKTKEMTARLQKALSSKEADLGALLSTLLDTNDQNFQERYDIFYKQVAPLLELYRIRLGDILTIKAFTRYGYIQSVNVKVYGTFQFKGLDKSALAGSINLMDLMSFRELYGYMTSDKLEEIKQLQAQAGAKQVDRANAEQELFGSGEGVVTETSSAPIDEPKSLGGAARSARTEDLIKRVYTKQEIEEGVFLNAAVILKDPEQQRQTVAQIAQAAKQDGLPLKVVGWQQASGLPGQFVLMIKGVLYVSMIIIFVVALVIIVTAMMMATLRRIQEIGTMRAIGAQRGFVLQMVLVETATLGAVFGALGALLGSGVIGLIHLLGIPAATDQLYFLFSGPRLRPSLTGGNLLLGFGLVFVVALLSALYPALLATRVSPIRAMQNDE